MSNYYWLTAIVEVHNCAHRHAGQIQPRLSSCSGSESPPLFETVKPLIGPGDVPRSRRL